MRKPYKRMTAEEKDRMVAMYQEGMTPGEIAKVLGKTHSLIRYHLKIPKKRIFQFKIFTPEQIAKIEECYEKGGRVSDLAKALGCCRNTIYNYAQRKHLQRKYVKNPKSPEAMKALDKALDRFLEIEPPGSSWNFVRR